MATQRLKTSVKQEQDVGWTEHEQELLDKVSELLEEFKKCDAGVTSLRDYIINNCSRASEIDIGNRAGTNKHLIIPDVCVTSGWNDRLKPLKNKVSSIKEEVEKADKRFMKLHNKGKLSEKYLAECSYGKDTKKLRDGIMKMERDVQSVDLCLEDYKKLLQLTKSGRDLMIVFGAAPELQ